jgi:hypothetical protein
MEHEFFDLIVQKNLDEIAEDIGFSANIFMVFGLPTRKQPDSLHDWTKKTSLCDIIITRHPKHEIPYGCYARMNQIFIDTEVKMKHTHVIELGDTFNEYVKKIGYTEGFANKALLRQLLNYITSVIRVEPKNRADTRIVGVQSVVGRAWDIYFDVKNPDQMCLIPGQIILSTDYAEYIYKHAVPLDMNVIRAFKRNPLALDFYRYLAYRNNGLDETIAFPDYLLFEQFGTEQQTDKITRNRLRKILRAIRLFWPVQAKFEDGFFELKPSIPAVPTKTLKWE